MRKWALLAGFAVACSSRSPSMGTSLTGAPTARDAASMFMGAVKSQDLQAMGAVWGSEQGAARDHMEREELDKRLVLLQQCYDHDRFQLLEESIGQEGTRQVRVQVTRGTRTRTPNFKLIQGPSDRWYVADTDFPTVQEFCRPGNSAPSR